MFQSQKCRNKLLLTRGCKNDTIKNMAAGEVKPTDLPKSNKNEVTMLA